MAAEKQKICIFTSEEIVREISQVLSYPKLKKVYEAAGLRHEDLIETILRIAKFVKITKKIKVVSEHPADDKFIECAFAAGAHFVVSGDKHLLRVVSYKETQILSVSEFLKVQGTN